MTESHTLTTADDDIRDEEIDDLHGEVLVDSGRILLVDPCHLSDELVGRLTTPNDYGVTVGVMVHTLSGDGAYPVFGNGDIHVLDPYIDDDLDDDLDDELRSPELAWHATVLGVPLAELAAFVNEHRIAEALA